MIKAIFFDLDGTLLDSKKKIPDNTIEYLKKCREIGIRLYISTARLPKCRDTLKFGSDVKALFDGGVFCNGAVVEMGNECSYSFLPENTVKKLLTSLKPFPEIYISVQMKDNIHAFNKPIPIEEKMLWGLEENKMFSTESCSCVEVIKLLIFEGGYFKGLNELSNDVINIVRKECGKDASVYLTDGGKILQINAIGVSKYNGTETIRKSLGLEKIECAVFGDDYNDLEMIEGYENSVAMGNSPEELKNAASYITDDNDSDGIAKALKKLIKV